MHPSERIAPLFARLGSLGELRSLSEPTKIRRRSQKLRPSRGNFCARNWRAPIPTLRANLASRIAGLFARTYAKIRRRTRPPPLAGRVCPVRDANYALGIGSDLAPVPPGAGEASPAPGGTGPPASLTGWRPSRGQLRRPVRDANSDSTREPTPPKGGSADPLRGSSRVPA